MRVGIDIDYCLNDSEQFVVVVVKHYVRICARVLN